MPSFLSVAHRTILERPEPQRVTLAYTLSILIFCGLVLPLMLSGLPLLLKVLLMVYPTVSVANAGARLVTGIDLQDRTFR